MDEKSVSRDLFLKNTQALFEVDEALACKLRMLQNFDFKIIKDENGINFQKENHHLYKNPNQELLESLTLFKNEYEKYPVLFFYGFGNGMFYKALCENKHHKHLIVFEDNLEILALAFYLFDFSEELKNEKLILFHTPHLNTAQLTTLFTYEAIQTSVKIFNLFIHCDFYTHFYQEQIQNLNTYLIEMIRFVVLNKGNDPHDSLIGIQHILANLPKMLNHGIFQDFLKERRMKAKNAIIVSTGPSLTKQLPLLKQYVNKAVIFCADSAYPILAKYNIKPDYVAMLERSDFTAEFFNNDFGEFDKDILFMPASVVHENAIKFLEHNQRHYMLIHRPLHFAASLKLDEYGYLGVGLSVANMIYELTGALRFENIILIGQDLAYADNGNSHPDDYQHSATYESSVSKHLQTLAYGGKGEVKTQLIWNLFRQAFEKDIFWAKEKLNITTYNCTEGGARIEGTIEKPFLWACENLLGKDLNKPFNFPNILDQKSAQKKLEKTYNLIQKNLLESKEFIKKTQKELQKLKYTLENKENDFDTLIKIKNNLIQFFKEFKKLKLFNELTQATHFHNECEIVKFEVLNQNKQKENLIDFLKIQYNWFMQGLGYLDTQNQSIEKIIKDWSLTHTIQNNTETSNDF